MSNSSQDFLRQLGIARERLEQTRLTDTALAYCISGIERMEETLRKPLRVVILGEYNSGKTSVADLLIGEGLLPTSVVSNTKVPVLVTHAETAAVFGLTAEGVRVRVDSENDDLVDLDFRALQIALPLERLRAIQVLDTPSGNPAAFLDEADIVIWCTVATRAWTETERSLWSSLPQRCRRNALLVATHKDGLHIAEEVASVSERLRTLTKGLFRDVVMVSADGSRDGGGESADATLLRDAVMGLVADISERRTQKADKIVRRLARLTFHHLQSSQLRLEAQILLADWQRRSGLLLEQLAQGKHSVPETIEALLRTYAAFAELMKPGVVTGDSIPATSSARTLSVPVRWPTHSPAAQRLARTLVADLTALLRMLATQSSFSGARQADYHTARTVLLSLADLDSAFVALGRMLGSAAPDAAA